MHPALATYGRGLVAQYAEDAEAEAEWLAKADLLLDTAHPFQRMFLEDPSRWIVVLTGGRCGKTTGGTFRLLRRAILTRNARTLFIAETKPHAEELIWLPLKEITENLGIQCNWNETKMICTLLHNRSQIKLVGADDKREINKLRGVPRHEVGIDEGASHPPKLLEQLIERVLMPRLGDYSGALWLVGTPGHIFRGFFYEATRNGSEISRPYRERNDDKWADWAGGWSFHHWSMQDAAPYAERIANAWREAQETKRLNGWEDDNGVWRREYLGIWAQDDTESVFRYRPHDDDGSLFNRWTPRLDPRTKFAELPEGRDWCFLYGLDMGHSDPFAVVVLAHDPVTNELKHVFEYEERKLAPRDIARLLVGDEWVDAINRGDDPPAEPGGWFGVTGWPLSTRADTSHLGGAIIQELVEIYGIPIEKAEQKNKHDAIEVTNGDFTDRRLSIIGESKLEVQVSELQWNVDEETGRLKEDTRQANNLTDALIYARQGAPALVATPQIESATPSRRVPPHEKRRARHRRADPQIAEFDLAEIDLGEYDDDDFDPEF